MMIAPEWPTLSTRSKNMRLQTMMEAIRKEYEEKERVAEEEYNEMLKSKQLETIEEEQGEEGSWEEEGDHSEEAEEVNEDYVEDEEFDEDTRQEVGNKMALIFKRLQEKLEGVSLELESFGAEDEEGIEVAEDGSIYEDVNDSSISEEHDEEDIDYYESN
jgi:hypothetical protein